MTQKLLLSKLLATLVEEWGNAEVQAALSSISQAHQKREPTSGKLSPYRAQRPSAVDQVRSANAAEKQTDLLLRVAEKFDRKEFLPSIADVREFIILTGERPVAMRDRSESFRVLLKYLLRLPPERLYKIIQAASHSGPAQLGPISDAISAAGERLDRPSLDSVGK